MKKIPLYVTAACVGALAAGCSNNGGGSASSLGLPASAMHDALTRTSGSAIAEYTIPPPAKTRFKAFPIGISNGPDGALWFAERGWGKLGRIKTDGTITAQYSLKVEGDGPSRFPQNVTTGPDNNLWATCGTLRTYHQLSNGVPDPYGSIRQMTPSGRVIGVYHLPTMYSDPRGITPWKGDLWFAERRGAIGQMTTGGSLVERPIKKRNGVYGVAVGPDQNFWFAETFNDIIGRITKHGEVSYFSLPKKAGPAAIVAGPDGYLYGTEFLGGKVAQITTSGVVTAEWPLSSDSSPKGIAVGSDGNLYVAEFSTGKIARIILTGTMVGKVTEFAIPTPHSGPWGITSGPDGNIWFTESLTGKIGKLTLPK